jgi:hypothetical protein
MAISAALNKLGRTEIFPQFAFVTAFPDARLKGVAK